MAVIVFDPFGNRRTTHHFWENAFSPEGLAVAVKTVARFAERVPQLYEHGADDLCIGAYARRWQRWVVSGLGSKRTLCLGAWLLTGRRGDP